MKKLPLAAMLVAAALAASTVLVGFAGPAAAATCSDDTLALCGVDFSAVAGVEFSGQIASEDLCFPGDNPGDLVIDWGDDTPTSTGTGTCLNPDLSLDELLYGTHTYSAPGTYTVTITDNGWLVNGEPPTGTATATVRQQAADLGVTINAPGTAHNGDTLIYAIDVSNAGIDPARNVVMVDNLRYGTVFQAVTATGWTCSTPKVGQGGGSVTCTIDPLGSGDRVATSIGVKVKAHVGRGVITNAAAVSSDTPDPNSSNNTASVSTTVVR